MQGLAWSKINHLAVQPFLLLYLLQVEVTMGKNSNEVTDYSIIIKQTPIKQNLETK